MEEFNILEFLHYYWNKIIFVIICMVIGFIGSYIYTFNTQVPIYEARTSLVLTKSDNTNTTITQNDIVLNKNLVSTYRQIIKSRRILDDVIKNLNLDLTYEELDETVEVSSVDETELIVISVYNEDNVLAKKIADQIAEVFKREITDIYNIENVSIIDYALVSDKPYNVHVIKQFAIGIALGFVFSSAIIFLFFYMDDTIKNEEEIESKVGLSVLGAVPKYAKKKK